MKTFSTIVGGIVLLALFVGATLLANEYAAVLHTKEALMGPWGKVQYVLITAFAVVIAPFSTVPLIPVATSMWGGWWSAVLSILGWTLGAQIAFELSQSIARPFILKRISLHKAEQYARVMLGKNQFLMLLVLRMCIPVDILSYAIGLFVPMRRISYFFATLIGVSPFAFVFAYASSLPILYQVVTFVGACLIAVIASWRITHVKK